MNKSSCECVFSNLIGVFLGGASGEESTCQCRRLGFDPWVQKIPWSRKWQPTLIFLPGKSHGQWSLAGYSPLGHREMDTLSICTYNLVGRRELPSSYKLGGVGAGGEGDDRGWDVWMASPTRWTWVWVNSQSWWWTGRPGVLWFMGLQRVGHDWATERNPFSK